MKEIICTIAYEDSKIMKSKETGNEYLFMKLPDEDYIVCVDKNNGNKFIEGWCGCLNEYEDDMLFIRKYERKHCPRFTKEYYGADEIYISNKTNEIYTAYHFGDVKYVIMREREYENGGSSVINYFFYDEEENLFDILKDYADLFERMETKEYMERYNHI